MAIPIEGYSVVVKKSCFELHKDDIEIPNNTALGDDDIWCCSFMSEQDARVFVQKLEAMELNGSQGPDSDIVLVNEFDQSIEPYCEWLSTTKWEKAVIAWAAGTKPESVVAREGWDPKRGSGLVFATKTNLDDLEFVRVDGNVEVYRDKVTGEERFIGRTETPIEALYKSASRVIGDNLRTAGMKPLQGEVANQVAKAVEQLEEVIKDSPDAWGAHWHHGKGLLALGDNPRAYTSLERAYELEPNVEAVPRELAGVALELGKFDVAVSVSQHAVTLQPDSSQSIGNHAIALLLAKRVPEAKKAIAAAMNLEPNDNINKLIGQVIAEVDDGSRPQPESMADLQTHAKQARKSAPNSGASPASKQAWWKFW